MCWHGGEEVTSKCHRYLLKPLAMRNNGLDKML